MNDPVIKQAFSLGLSPESMIILLSNERVRLMEKLVTMELIAPRRITRGGRTFVWHCPDHLIPEIE